jgi:hypothetical protein
MVVVVLMGFMLLLVPASLDGFGKRSRLEAAANSLVAVLTGMKEQAVIDGHETVVQYEIGNPRDRAKGGRVRVLTVNRVRQHAKGEEGATDAPRPVEVEEMIAGAWRAFPDGVVLAGYSQERDQWVRSNPGGGEPISVRFLPDGTVRPPHAVRFENLDMDRGADRAMTVVVNALSSAAGVVEGEAELPMSRDAADFK